MITTKTTVMKASGDVGVLVYIEENQIHRCFPPFCFGEFLEVSQGGNYLLWDETRSQFCCLCVPCTHEMAREGGV